MDLREKWNKSTAGVSTDKSVSNYAVLSEKEFERNSLVADLGGGTGVDALYFLHKGHEAILADVSDYGLNIAKKRAEKDGFEIKTVENDFSTGKINLDNDSVDIVYSHLALHYFDRGTTIK